MRVTIIPEDETVIVGGIAHRMPQMPPLDANTHAIQFYPESGHVTVEKRVGDREHFGGAAAAQLVKPFVDAYAAHTVVIRALDASKAEKRAAAEQEVATRHTQIRAGLKASDAAAAEAAHAAEVKRREAHLPSPTTAGNMTSSGTQAI